MVWCTSDEGTTAISAEMASHRNGLKLHHVLLFKVWISGVERNRGKHPYNILVHNSILLNFKYF